MREGGSVEETLGVPLAGRKTRPVSNESDICSPLSFPKIGSVEQMGHKHLSGPCRVSQEERNIIVQ